MSTAEVVNSPIFIALLSALLTIGGVLLKMLWAALVKVNERLQAQELKTNDIDGVKNSIANLGQRLGSVEAQDQVQAQMFRQLTDTLNDIKDNEKQNAQVFTEIFNSLSTIKTDLSIIKFRLDSEDKDHK